MQTTANECDEETSFSTTFNDNHNELNVKNSIDCISRILTLTDVYPALNTLEINQNFSRKRTNSPETDPSAMLSKRKTQSIDERNCCRLVRTNKFSRLSLPLARRCRPHILSRSLDLLCENCSSIKQQQEKDILKTNQHFKPDIETHTTNIFETITDLNKETKDQMMIEDIPHEIEFSLISDNDKNHSNSSEYESAETLVWQINTSDNHNQAYTINRSHETGSLTDNEKKKLIQEAIQKLQIVLSNRSPSTTTTIPDSDLDKIEFTYRALQTTVCILSSSLD